MTKHGCRKAADSLQMCFVRVIRDKIETETYKTKNARSRVMCEV